MMTTNSFTGSFDPSASGATHYLVVREAATPVATAPTNNTNYIAGQSLGTGTVLYNGALTTFFASGLSANTTYTLTFYAYNNSNCQGPVYNTTGAYSTTVTTCSSTTTAPGSLTANQISTSRCGYNQWF
jgi:hypothetical protein